MKKKYWIVLLIIIALYGCDNPSEPVEEKQPYMTLNVGDIRQFHETESYSTSIWEMDIQIEVESIKYRTDGKEVYRLIKLTKSAEYGFSRDTTYAFIENGYYWETAIDTVYSPRFHKDNPFMETRMINIYPDGDEYFLANEGVIEYREDYHLISMSDSLETPVKTFYNVEKCIRLSYYAFYDPNEIIYFAPDYGYIGKSVLGYDYKRESFLTYLKINGEELGEFLPINN